MELDGYLGKFQSCLSLDSASNDLLLIYIYLPRTSQSPRKMLWRSDQSRKRTNCLVPVDTLFNVQIKRYYKAKPLM